MDDLPEELMIEAPEESEERLVEPFVEDELKNLPRHADETSE